MLDIGSVVLTDRGYGARLQALSAFRMLRDEMHFVADRELVEYSAHDTIAMEIDFAAVGGRNETVIFLWEQPDYPTVIG
jgi:hypothetical protein